MPDDMNTIPADQNQDPANQDDNIPEWMREAGWQEDSGTFDESKPIFDDLDRDGEEDEIVPADIPAWLEDAAPDGFSVDPNATPAFEGIDSESFITTGDLMPSSLPDDPPPPLNQEEEIDPITESEPELAADPAPVSDPSQAEKQPGESGIDIPSWLKNLEMDEDSQETAVAWLENMPDELRATEEEKAAALASHAETVSTDATEDDLAWMDNLAEQDQPAETDVPATAELSENLVASELIPEQSEEDTLFAEEEIRSAENDVPAWLKELDKVSTDTDPAGTDSGAPAASETPVSETAPQSEEGMVPEWLSETSQPAEEPAPAPEAEAPIDEEAEGDLPDWLSDFDGTDPEESDEVDASLDWLDTLGKDQQSQPQAEGVSAPPSAAEEIQAEGFAQADGSVSPNDETLNTQVPNWLSKLGEDEEPQTDFAQNMELAGETETSWAEEIDDPGEDSPDPGMPGMNGDVLDWLDQMEEPASEEPASDLVDLAPSPEVSAQEPVELETAKYFQEEEETSDSLPDWLSELAQEEDDQATTLEGAIRQSDHPLTDAEVEFLERSDQVNGDNEEWLAKLDARTEEQAAAPEPTLPVMAEAAPAEEMIQEEDDDDGGMLDRLQDAAEPVEDIPQWLADLKKEEDPQETAILWLKQFVEQGNSANVHDEIKRYTDELNPGDVVPKWMEDLKNEEDPQTTAMLWLEKLAGEQSPATPITTEKAEGEASWLDELEEEASQQSTSAKTVEDFEEAGEDWLSDLEIDEKLKADEPDIPDWSATTDEEEPKSETPSWMKATSPLEGDFHTDELAGSAEKEVEIPEWLAGYGEGEEPESEAVPGAEEESDQDEYAWVSASDAPQPVHEPIDLNKAAISQLEAILGISYQIAQGIVQYREKNGPYRDIKDLLKVPEIKDEQTIEILKPAVTINVEDLSPVPESTPEPEPVPSKPVEPDAAPDVDPLQLAQASLNEGKIQEALDRFSVLIKKKTNLDQVISSLLQAAIDHPVDISVLKTLGDAYMRADQLDEALEAYSRAEDLLS